MSRRADDNFMRQVAARQRFEQEPREYGEVPLPTAGVVLAKITSEVGAGIYEGVGLTADAILYNAANAGQLKDFRAQTEIAVDTIVEIKGTEVVDDDTLNLFEYIEGLPPGGIGGQKLHRDDDGVAYWNWAHITYPEPS